MKLTAKTLILCIFTQFFYCESYRSNTIVVSKRLQWEDISKSEGARIGGLNFEGSSADAASGELPRFVHSEPLTAFGTIRDLRCIETETGDVPSALVNNDILGKIGNNWKIDARVSDGGGKPFLVIELIPLRKTGRDGLERLIEFTLTIEIDPGPRPASRSLTFAESSVLTEGNWYKLAVDRDGVCKIDKNTLSLLGIDITSLDPDALNIYGNGGELLPSLNSEPRYDDLQKCAIHVEGAADQVFNDNDYILFYAKGCDTWKESYNAEAGRSRWEHNKHFYSDSAYYFLRTDDTAPLRITTLSEPQEAEDHTISRFQDYVYRENDLYNLAKSGREFFGDQFEINTTGSFSFSMPNLLPEFPALFETRVAIRSMGGASNFTINLANTTLQSVNVTTNDGALASVAGLDDLQLSFTPSGSSITVNYTFNKYSSTAEVRGYIDYIRINATRSLSMTGTQMHFRDTTVIAPGSVGRFLLGSASSVSRIWDVSDPLHPYQVNFTLNGTTAEWKAETASLHQYIAFSNSGYLPVTPLGKIANQNLHGLSDIDLVIVSAPALLSSANSIAEIHSADGMSVVVTTPIEIFNEFSSGTPDVTAIRMLMKMLYDRANGDESKMPQNLLMLGDGDYSKNKGISAFTGSNVMIFESDNSLSPSQSYVSDDYFVFLSDEDDADATNLLDCGVGRIPASDPSEAAAFVEKIKAYIAANTTSTGAVSCIGDEVQSPYGPWRNVLTFVSDDQDGGDLATEAIHLEDADQLAALMKEVHPEYDVVKIYMDAYKQESTPGGERYPDGETAIRNRVQNGSLLVTYLGHGGERGWAHERILDLNTITSWTNLYRLPVFLTATCELARYDDPGFNTAGELLVMNPNGGAIAMLTTTRIVFAGSNMQMDLAFFDVALEEENISNLTLGKINMLTKNGVSPSNTSKPNFSLLGDPALRMVYPKYHVYTSEINGIPLTTFSDTLKALQEVEFKGYVGDAQGNKLTNFNGFVYPTVFDKLTHVFTQNNDFDGEHGVVQEYDVFNKNIFKGKASVTAGDFSFRFVVPYDINYTVDTGRVSYYAVAGNFDAHGYSQDFRIGSSLNGAQLNTVGPDISLFMNDTTFVSGGITNTNPVLIARLKDENGINTVGNGIGHDLLAVLDNDSQNPIVLNEYYETDLNTYKSGELRFQMPDLSPGNHSISLKAWDVHNNSSTASLDFTVAENSVLALEHVLNYPNPFTTHTEFMFEHNQACTVLDVRLQIFTVSGKLVKTFEQELKQEGFRSEPIVWDGTDDFGDRIGRGVYVYKLEIRNEDGQKAEQFEKLVILR